MESLPDPDTTTDPGGGSIVDQPPAPVVWRGYTLSKFQRQAVAAIRAGSNVLVSAPTGAGKTLVAEFAVEDAVRRSQRCIYTAPIKALSNQKYRDFRNDPEVDVGIMTGDVTIHPDARVLVMTTEILRNAIFENPTLLHDVAYVIFDEVHYMDDRERGTVWEESLIFLPPKIRVIALSATISNVDEIGAWMREIREQPVAIIRSSKRPVPLSHWAYTDRTGTIAASKVEKLAKAEARDTRSRGRGSRRGGSRSGRGGGRGRGRGRTAEEPPNSGRLFDELERKGFLPALVFSFSRKDCERLARQNEYRKLLDDADRKRMVALQHELIELFQLAESELDGPLFSMARNGVSHHHAGMLPVHKEVVERMFTAGLLPLLFTTETFALGINMPARSVVFQALRKFDGISFDWLRTRDYMQMAGRAGRQGIDDEGYVYSILDSRAMAEAPLARLIAGQPEPVVSRFRLGYSTLLHLVDRLGRDRLHDAWEKSFNQFQGRVKNKRAQEKHRRIQGRVVDAHLELLTELGYLHDDEVTSRGRIAKLINGYELQVTEMLFRGTLENLPPRALAVIFVGLIHEERRTFDRPWVPSRLFGNERHRAGSLVAELCSLEARYGIQPGMKRPDWGLTPAAIAWYDGCPFEALEEHTAATAGDLCRVFRMAIQLMRNVRRAIDPEWDLADKLREAVEAMNRDEIDARRQLELG